MKCPSACMSCARLVLMGGGVRCQNEAEERRMTACNKQKTRTESLLAPAATKTRGRYPAAKAMVLPLPQLMLLPLLSPFASSLDT